jgi:hypothetical protein
MAGTALPWRAPFLFHASRRGTPPGDAAAEFGLKIHCNIETTEGKSKLRGAGGCVMKATSNLCSIVAGF